MLLRYTAKCKMQNCDKLRRKYDKNVVVIARQHATHAERDIVMENPLVLFPVVKEFLVLVKI